MESSRRPPARTVAVAGSVDYELHSLGWFGFQSLCLTISREVLGQDVVAFLENKDGGRDGAWQGTWRSEGHGTEHFVLQCKHTSKRARTLNLSNVENEAVKARRLVEAGRCDVYVLLTNATVSGIGEEEIARAFRSVGVKRFVCLGYTWICNTIRDNKRLRMLVPRVYGLGDLTQILDERAYRQADALLSSMHEDLAKVVLTDTYTNAAEAIETHGFVLLLGAPAAGKTTIAALLALAAIDQWGASTIKIDSPLQLPDRWNPEEPTQFFWIDDAFGTTQYELGRALDWNRVLSHVSTAIRSGAKVVMTSRDYIYKAARDDLKAGAFPLLNESQVVVDVEDLTVDERKQILYNHLRLGNQPRKYLTSIKPFLDEVAEHPRFMPETARRLADPTFTRGLAATKDVILNFVESPVEFLLEVLAGLDAESQAALGLIYMSRGMLESPLDPTPSQATALELVGATRAGVARSLGSLESSLVRQVVVEGQPGWVFKHPTITDAFSLFLGRSAELIDIYLAGADVERIVREVTCLDGSPQGALRVPRSRYPMLLERLAADEVGLRSRSLIYRFLARRADRGFLTAAISKWPDILRNVSEPGLYLDAVDEVPLAITLQREHLLPPFARDGFRETVVEYALTGQDFAVVTDPDFKVFFSEEEHAELVRRIHTETIPALPALLTQDLGIHSIMNVEEARRHAGPQLDMIDSLRQTFSDDAGACTALDEAERAVDAWVSGHGGYYDEDETENKTTIVPDPPSDEPHPGFDARSIFDDVDS